MKILGLVAVLCLFTISAIAQDPLKTLPNAYKLEFENEWVKVVRVHYAPHETLPAHDHTPQPSAYVYLNDGGPVVFNHIDKDYGAVTRPATKAGSFRVYKGIQEHHVVQNQSDQPSDFLRVEFKTDPVNEKSLKGRYYREEYPPGENFQKVQFENEQIRVTRLVCASGKTIGVNPGPNEPALLVFLSPGSLRMVPSNGTAVRLERVSGQTQWIGFNRTQLDNRGSTPVEMLRFDFKTTHLSREEREHATKREHP